jgi:hypothetical protein
LQLPHRLEQLGHLMLERRDPSISGGPPSLIRDGRRRRWGRARRGTDTSDQGSSDALPPSEIGIG